VNGPLLEFTAELLQCLLFVTLILWVGRLDERTDLRWPTR
jgi:hypothetical protein